MAEAKTTSSAPKSAKSDFGAGEVQKQVDQAEGQGFYGRKVDPRPNSEYSLESGPQSPAHVEDINTRTGQIGPETEADRA